MDILRWYGHAESRGMQRPLLDGSPRDAIRATTQRARTRAQDLDASLTEIIDRESQLEDVGIRRARRVTAARLALLAATVDNAASGAASHVPWAHRWARGAVRHVVYGHTRSA